MTADREVDLIRQACRRAIKGHRRREARRETALLIFLAILSIAGMVAAALYARTHGGLR